ncbi:hypothetical protein [Photobacterium galatheae]|uniref:Vitellogenin domain-containing protein n=1 Tax=Photobacterium galatheae TaxID=1654360 RepID=A0A066S0N5_9GAMM|nr:hypothetical protein [Photobacterium galatheae]KDM93173.1 hypothetical protein EA58_02995 [Photobacterium galatheae]MCM0148298.1 hypothetical protein [Photobacterium galatheae]
MKNKLLIMLALVCCVVAGASLYIFSGSSDAEASKPQSATDPIQTQTTQSNPTNETPAFQESRTPASSQAENVSHEYNKQVFDVRYGGDIAFSAPGTSVEQSIRFDLSGELFQYRQSRDDQIYHLLRMPAPTVTAVVNQQTSPEIVDAIRQQVQEGIEFVTTPEGEIQEVYLSQPHPSLKTMETIAFLMQNIVPETVNDQDQWERTEQDYNGEFSAYYNLKLDDSATSANKIYQLFKRRELKKALYDQARGLENKLSAEYTFSHKALWDQNRRMLTQLSVDESVQHHMNGQPLATSRNLLDMKLTFWTDSISPVELALIKHTQAGRQIQLSASDVFLSTGNSVNAASGSQQQQAKEKDARDQAAQGVSTTAEAAYQEIKDLYDAMLSLEGLERMKAENQLSAMLQNFARAYPGNLDLLTNDLTKFGTQEPGFSLYLSALSTVASLPAQDAMLTTLNARMSETQAATSIMASLALSPQGNTQTFERFSNLMNSQTMSDGLSANVDLAKSAMVQRMGVEDTTTANGYVSEQLQQLKTSADPSQTLHHLTVLGNMGQYLTFSDLQSYTEQSNADIRQRATHALRFVPGADATNYLMTTLKNDTNAGTREVAANSLSYRSLDSNTLAQIQQQIDQESNQQIKDRLQGIVDKYNTPNEAITQ